MFYSAAKESMKVEYQQQERLHQRKILDETANAKQIQADRDSLNSRVSTT